MMGFVLGFGKTEQDVEAELENQIRREVASGDVFISDGYFSKEYTASVGRWLNDLARQSRDSAAEYKTAADHPDRYTYFFAATLGDASHLVFIIKFHHVNRKHPFSPDGWALIETERVFYIRHNE